MPITKIVITGGPCAGKSTAMSWIGENFTKLGYTVLFVPETATELITGGVAPWTCGSQDDFQTGLIRLQLAKEAVFAQAAAGMKGDKILMVCDRGALDARAYMTPEGYTEVLRSLGQSEVELRDGYDAVFHLVTAARGAETYYTTQNNAARTETPEEARQLDDKVIAAWTGHPHLRVIDNSTDFAGKIKRLIAEISSFLGEPEPFEVERKFLIEYPDLEELMQNQHCQRVEMIQTYLKTREGVEMRVRQRGLDGNYTYYLTTKQAVTPVKRVEVEERLSRDEYLRHLMDADPDCRPVRKDRYCLTYLGQYFEIDVYPFWQDKAIVEIELCDEDSSIEFPPCLKIIREVTNDPDFKNAALARRRPS
ncbi:MAG: AAA family ATPase [Clostridia bacterium]|nr:AAA family ATPase [Clostridia bacterium]